jgi:hypothetical protein
MVMQSSAVAGPWTATNGPVIVRGPAWRQVVVCDVCSLLGKMPVILVKLIMACSGRGVPLCASGVEQLADLCQVSSSFRASWTA